MEEFDEMIAKLPGTSRGRPLPESYKIAIQTMAGAGYNRQEVADKLGITWFTVDKYWDFSDPAIAEIQAKRKNQFIDACWANINDALTLGKDKVKLAQAGIEGIKIQAEKLLADGVNPDVVAEVTKALTSMANIPLSHISTYIGTLYDKQALAQGDPTEIARVVSWEDLEEP